MNIPKGTHIDFLMKWCTHKAVAIVVVTICTHACVCMHQRIYAQDTRSKLSINTSVDAQEDPVLAMLLSPVGRVWVITGIQRSFGLKELDEPWISAGATRSRYSLALTGSTMGWEQMRHWVFASYVGYATEQANITLGADMRMLRLGQPYRDDKTMTLRADIRRSIGDDTYTTIRIQNILGSEWQVGGDPIERKLQFDLNTYLLPNVLIRAGIAVSDHYPADYLTDILWRANDGFVLAVGLGSMPSRIHLGMSIDARGWFTGSGFSKITSSSIGWRQNYWLGRLSE
jgi:hypothetical protein